MLHKYSKPLQSRAIATENKLLDALDTLLRDRSLGQLTIDAIAEHSHLTRGAFLKRFGSKKQALFVLWARYCDKCIAVETQLANSLDRYPTALEACADISREIEILHTEGFSANRAMNEDFLEDLMIDPATKKIFLAGVDLMHRVRTRFLRGGPTQDSRDFASAQVIITLNYNYVLRAAPGLPSDQVMRHRLIARLVVEAMKQ